MKLAKMIGVAFVLPCVAMFTVGCQDKQLKEMQGQYNELNTKYTELQAKDAGLQQQLVDAESRNTTLTEQNSAKDRELAVANATINQLKKQPGGPGAKTPVTEKAEGPETQLFKAVVVGDMLFKSGQAVLTADGARELDKTVTSLKSHAGKTVRVYGYTDSDPIVKSAKLWQDNLDLSANRAMAVSRYLASKGIVADHIETIAMGAANPVAPNTNTANKAKNRRVEIIVVNR